MYTVQSCPWDSGINQYGGQYPLGFSHPRLPSGVFPAWIPGYPGYTPEERRQLGYNPGAPLQPPLVQTPFGYNPLYSPEEREFLGYNPEMTWQTSW